MAAPSPSPVNFPNKGNLFSNIVKPIDINMKFIVNHADTGGLGITGLVSNGYVKNVFMNTNQTPGANNGVTNPNPAAGFALIQLAGNFNKHIGTRVSIASPAGSNLKIDNGATLSIGQVYQITTLGNATAAQWTTIGVPAGVTPAVGVAFVAIATGAGSGNTSTSRVAAPSVSGITSAEIVGSPTATCSTSNSAQNGGAYLLLQFLAPTIASVATTPAVTNAFFSPLIPTAPADKSTIEVQIRMDGSSVSVDGL